MVGHAPAPGSWSFEPLQLAGLGLIAGAYALRAGTLRRRGAPVPRRRRLLFAAGLAVLALALVSPIDTIGEERLFSVHMAQHLLIGDVAPLLVVLGLTGPLLRPLLALPVVGRLRILAHPLVALPLWGVNICVWHLPALYDAALARGSVHATQHMLFFAGGALLWAVVLEPVPAPRWFGTDAKAGALVGAWIVGGVLSNVFIWSGHAFYARYAHAPRLGGLSASADQRVGGGLMLLEMSVVVLGAAAWMFLRLMRETGLRQELLDQGIDPRVAGRAVRYGRGRELTRPG